MNDFVFISLNGQYNDEIENNRSERFEEEFSVLCSAGTSLSSGSATYGYPYHPFLGIFVPIGVKMLYLDQ